MALIFWCFVCMDMLSRMMVTIQCALFQNIATILNTDTRAVRYADVRTMLEHAGFELWTDSGSGVKFYHPEHKLYLMFHSPHPSPEIKGGALIAVRKFCDGHKELFQ